MDNVSTVITMFLAFSALVTMSSEALKALVKIYFPDLKCGMIIAFIFGISLSFTYGTGLLAGLFGVAYESAWAPLGYRIVDLAMSGTFYMLGSKSIIDLLERTRQKTGA